jgi:hypothetical protein
MVETSEVMLELMFRLADSVLPDPENPLNYGKFKLAGGTPS